MYDDIRKPRLLKDVPILYIRALPSIYYFSRYNSGKSDEEAKAVYLSNLDYLHRAICLAADRLSIQRLTELAGEIKKAREVPKDKLLKHHESIAERLAELTTEHRKDFRNHISKERPLLIEEYKNIVKKLRVLIIAKSDDVDKVKKTASMLKNFCYYDVQTTSMQDASFAQKMNNNDVVLFFSVRDSRIHEDIKVLDTYKKPGLALAVPANGGKVDNQSIRHGAQLMKIGFPVLFKVFTPIRLFTTIDKLYMAYRLV